MPELVDIDEDQDTVIVVPADQNADKDFFEDSERQSAVKQKYDSEIKQAPWTPQTDSDNPLTKIGDMIPKATPVYEGFWRNSDLDILARLNAASEELKAKRKTQKETPKESSPNGQNEINEIDVEDPHPDRPVSISTDKYLRQLGGYHVKHPHGTCDTSDRPTQGDTPNTL